MPILLSVLTESPWLDRQVNECRLQVMNQCRQTQIPRGFTLIVDDSGHRKSGNLTAGVGRQYLGEIGKTDNGIVAVTTHLYDGKKSVPLDMEIYQPASSLAEGKEDKEFKKKPEIAIDLIDRSLTRGYRPKIVLIDAGYGNNTPRFLQNSEFPENFSKLSLKIFSNSRTICHLLILTYEISPSKYLVNLL